MPPWFDHWYHQQLLAVHQKLKDPEESTFWLNDQLKKAGPPPPNPANWKQYIAEAINILSAVHPQEELPDKWEELSSSDQHHIKDIFVGNRPLSNVREGEELEVLLSPLLSGTSLQGEKALWVWQYLLGRIGMTEENLMRHWVDAEEENLQAFEDRYELHDQICRIPGTISIDPQHVWQSCFPNNISTASEKPTSRRTRHLMIGILIVSMIAAFSAVMWVDRPEGDTVTLSESLTAQMLAGNSPIVLERNQLTFIGEARLTVEVKDSIRMLGGLVIFDPGVYLVELDSEQKGSFFIESGQLKAFLGEEVFVVEEGMVLENDSGYWLKEWE